MLLVLGQAVLTYCSKTVETCWVLLAPRYIACFLVLNFAERNDANVEYFERAVWTLHDSRGTHLTPQITKREAHPKKSQHPGSASSEKSPAKKKKGAKWCVMH